MIIQPKVWGFICATAHPAGCEKNVRDDIETIRHSGAPANGPRRALVIGASTGYGLAARIVAAFGYGAATLGVFREKPGKAARPASAGWYNAAAFDRAAKQAGLTSLSLNGDAYAHATRERAIEMIRQQMAGSVDLVIYSLAAPMRRLPDSGKVVHTALKPIGGRFAGTTIDMDRDRLDNAAVEPASEREIRDTTAVMGGDDWVLWMNALADAGVLTPDAKTVAFSYVGPEITWPIYRNGTIGRAKEHLEQTAARLREQGFDARAAIMKFIVTQASAAIPGIPLYAALILRVMQEKGLHEGAIEQQNRLFRDALYRTDGRPPATDADGCLRLDDLELRPDVQQACAALWPRITDDNLFELTDYAGYKRRFLQLFGFARQDIDYGVDVPTAMKFDCVSL